MFDVVYFIVDVFNYGCFFFVRRSWSRRWTMTTCLFLCSFFPIGITWCIFSDISKIIGKGYNVVCFHRYFDVMLFFIGNSQCFCISSKFPSDVSQLFFFCFSRPMVLLWTLTLAGGNFLLPAAESVRVLSRRFPNQAFCLDSALLERCDVRLGRWQPSAIHVATT